MRSGGQTLSISPFFPPAWGVVPNELKVGNVSGFFRELFKFNVYKRTQGQLVRRLTMLGVIAVIAWGAYRFTDSSVGFAWLAFLFPSMEGGLAAAWVYGISVGLALFGLWFAYRLVNYSHFADFLIAVEAEMIKVSWPSNKELYVTTVVVITVMILMTVALCIFDLTWFGLYKFLRGLATGNWE